MYVERLLKRNLSSKVKNSQKSAISDSSKCEAFCELVRTLALGLLRQVEEINVLQSRIDGVETVARSCIRIHAYFVLSADQVRGDDVELSFERA